MKWMREQWIENPIAILSTNPPNHESDVEDESMDIALGKEAVSFKRKHHQALEGSLFSYTIRQEGRFQKVVRSFSKLSHKEQLESAMALFVEASDGYLVCNAPEFKDVEELVGRRSAEGLDNPFYRAVCEAILEGFVESGWMESPLE
jgi:hypothetical protein